MRLFLPLFLIAICTASCKTSRLSPVKLSSDNSFDKIWQNKTVYQEAQDYVKNLDYKLLEDPDAHPVLKELLGILERAINGEGLALIESIQHAINTTSNTTLQSIYANLVYELLMDAGKYQALVENFPEKSKEQKIAPVFSTFPQESYSIAPIPISKPGLQKGTFGYFTLDIKANHEPIAAFFDTGSGITHMSKTFAKVIGVNFDSDTKIAVYTSTSQIVYGYLAYIEELIVGNILINNHPVLVFEDETITLQHKKDTVILHFTLGWPLIRNIKFQLDFIDQSYQTFLSEKTNTEFKNLFWLGYPGVKVSSSSGQSLIFGLDTGAKNTELRYHCLTKMNLSGLKDKTLEVGGLGGIEKIRGKTADNVILHLAGQRMKFKEIEILDDSDLFFIAHDGTIGADIFKDHRITLDFQNGLFKIE